MWDFLFCGFGALQVLLRSLLFPFEAVLGGLGPQKHENLKCFQGLRKCRFAHLGPSWADLVPKRAPKIAPALLQNVVQKLVQTFT